MSKDKSKLFTFGSIGITSVGGLLFVLAFVLPYWVDYNNDLSVNSGSGSYTVNLHYTYGFWRYCNTITSDVSNSDLCDAVDTHSGVEQATIALLLLTILLYVSTLVNSVLYISIFKNERLCLYISLISIIIAGILSSAGVINFGSADHSITVSSTGVLNFKASNLSASFWLAAVGCIDAVVTAIVIILAIRASRDENPTEDEKSILSSSPSRVSTDKLNFYSNAGSPERQQLQLDHSNSSVADDSSEDSLSKTSDSSSDSEDSEIDSKVSKLKFKNLRADDSISEHRPDSTRALTQKEYKTTMRRSQSAPYLTPVEQSHTVDFTEDLARVKTEKILHSVFHAGNIETNHPPPSTLISDISPIREINCNELRIVDDNDLRRANTEIIITKTRQPEAEQEYINVEDSVVEVEQKKTVSLKFLNKRKIIKNKRKEKKSGDKKKIKDVYTNTSDIPVFPRRKNAMPAPWTISEIKKKKGGQQKTSASMKWALVARGVYDT